MYKHLLSKNDNISNMGSTDTVTGVRKMTENNGDIDGDYGPNLKVLPTNDQVKELQTILRDK